MKYIVEFEDEPCMYEDEVHFYKCIQAPWWGLSERVIKQLTPYQPDIAPDTNVGNITNSCDHEKDHTADSSKMVCVDAISRQETIHAISDWIYDTTDERLPETVIRSLSAVQPEQKWIPCSERLPEEHEWIGTKKFGTTISDEVYVTFESPKGERFTTHLNFQNGKVSSFTDVFYKGAVPIAWMPLPEPYRGGDE